MHLKRNSAGNFWPIPRKGTKYVAVATHNKKNAIPLIIVMRDVLKIVKNKKELKILLNENKVLINNKKIREINYPIEIFDVLSLSDGRNYKAIVSKNKKIFFEEIKESEAHYKIYKILDKILLKKGIIQLKLNQGRNILYNKKANVGDSVIIDLKENKIKEVIPLEKGREAFVIKGKHAGVKGKIQEIIHRGGKDLAKIGDKEKINVWIKNIIVK